MMWVSECLQLNASITTTMTLNLTTCYHHSSRTLQSKTVGKFRSQLKRIIVLSQRSSFVDQYFGCNNDVTVVKARRTLATSAVVTYILGGRSVWLLSKASIYVYYRLRHKTEFVWLSTQYIFSNIYIYIFVIKDISYYFYFH